MGKEGNLRQGTVRVSVGIQKTWGEGAGRSGIGVTAFRGLEIGDVTI